MSTDDKILNKFQLINLYHPSNDDLEYLKKIEHNKKLMTYFGTLMIYVGKNYAYLIKYDNEYIGFLVIANDPYNKTKDITKELFLIIDEEHQHQGLSCLILEEVAEYLFDIENVANIIISPFNKIMIYIAEKVGFEDYNGFKLIKRNKNYVK